MKSLINSVVKSCFTSLTKISPNLSARLFYLMRMRRLPNLDNPKSFTEKLTWLKLNAYADNELVSNCADKYAVREYVSSKGHAEILNKLYGVYNTFDEIDLDQLPNRFALKGTHGCGYNFICNDKTLLNHEDIKTKVESWLKDTTGYVSSELHYTNIEPRLIVEKNISNEEGAVPIDYKIYCFNGEPKLTQVCSDRSDELKLNYFDNNWRELGYGKPRYRNSSPAVRPKNFKKMLSIAKDLSVDFPFVRVDLFNLNGKIIFGELTFTPACGCSPRYSSLGEVDMGALLSLEEKRGSVQVLMSTMNQDDHSILDRSNISSDAIIVNQSNRAGYETIKHRNRNVLFITLPEIGVGLSRNTALMRSTSDICLLADDDVAYDDDYESKVIEAFNQHPKADILLFNLPSSNDKQPLRIISKAKRVRLYNSLRYGACKFAFRTDKIKIKNIYFSLLFGGGAKYSAGEDSLFLYTCIRSGLRVYTCPVTLGKVNQNGSTWFKGYTDKFLQDKGAFFKVLSPKFALLLGLQYVVRKHSTVGNGRTRREMFSLIKMGISGINE